MLSTVRKQLANGANVAGYNKYCWLSFRPNLKTQNRIID